MAGFIDLHCHFVAGIDDGARTVAEGVEMLAALGRAGFTRVIATPHMRPGMFDNTREDLEAAYARMVPELAADELPSTGLSSEHYFDDVVFQRVLDGNALPYPGGRAVLLEFYEVDFPMHVDRMLSMLRRKGLVPVIAHPERYRAIWRAPETLERLLDAGAVALLDVAALVGKYGRRPQRSAEELLERGLYHAACSDAHRPADVDEVVRGIERLRTLYDADEVTDLFVTGPEEILSGTASP